MDFGQLTTVDGFNDDVDKLGLYIHQNGKIVNTVKYDTTYYAPISLFKYGLGYREKLDRDLYRVREDIIKFSYLISNTMLKRNGSLNVLLGLISYALIYYDKPFGLPFTMFLYQVDLYHPVFVEMTSSLSAYVKQRPDYYLRTVWLELNALGGFFTNTEYNPLPDIHALIDYRPYDRGQFTIKHFWQSLQDLPFSATKKLNFLDWLTESFYTTGGSSNLARIDIKINGQQEYMKGKKAWLPVKYEPAELYEMCKSATTFECKTGLKPELGKIRFFVGFDDIGYLIQSYVLYLMDKWYVGYDGVILDQTSHVALLRDQDIVAQMSESWSMPFDYQKFDHQITKIEVLLICLRIIEVVQTVLHSEDAWMRDKFMATVDDAFLSYLGNILNYLNGLLSGMRITSVVGNIWNLVISNRASKDLPVVKYILGDDTLYISKSKEILERILVQLKELNIEFSLEKFSITYGFGDFLRNTYTSSLIFGLPTRSLASSISRKPWNADPIDKRDKLLNLVSGLGTTFRRTGRYYDDNLIKKFCAGSKLNNLLGGSTSLGSIGGLINYNSSLSYKFKPKLSVSTIVSNNYVDNIIKNYIEYDLNLHQAISISDIQLVALLSADNISRVKFEVSETINQVYIRSINPKESVLLYELASYDGKTVEQSELYNNARLQDEKIANNTRLDAVSQASKIPDVNIQKNKKYKNKNVNNFSPLLLQPTPMIIDEYLSILFARLTILRSAKVIDKSPFSIICSTNSEVAKRSRVMAVRGARRNEIINYLIEYNLPTFFTFPPRASSTMMGNLYNWEYLPVDLTNHALLSLSLTYSILLLKHSNMRYYMS